MDLEPDPGAVRSARRDADRRRRVRRRRLALGAALALSAGLVITAIMVPGGNDAGRGRPAQATAAARPPTPTPANARDRAAPERPRTALPTAAQARAALDRTLARTSYIRRGVRRRKAVALTFDDGPGPLTPRLLTWLRRHDVPATFFLLGSAASAAPTVVRRIARDGHAIGDHTQAHPRLDRMTAGAQRTQIATAGQTLHALTGRTIRLFRPPYGTFDDATLRILRDRRMLMVLWSVDTKDYKRPGAKAIAYTALSGARAGSVLLMHDGGGDRAQTLAALPRIVRGLRRKGYRLVTVPQLLALDPPPRGQGPPRSYGAG